MIHLAVLGKGGAILMKDIENEISAIERDITERNKQYLLSVKESEIALKCLRAKIERLRDTLQLKGVNFDKEPSAPSGVNDRQQRVISEIVSLEMLLGDEEIKHVMLVYDVSETINALRDPNERAILTYRYICGYKWSKIFRAMAYDERQVYRIHKKALFNLKPPLNVSSK